MILKRFAADGDPLLDHKNGLSAASSVLPSIKFEA